MTSKSKFKISPRHIAMSYQDRLPIRIIIWNRSYEGSIYCHRQSKLPIFCIQYTRVDEVAFR